VPAVDLDSWEDGGDARPCEVAGSRWSSFVAAAKDAYTQLYGDR